MLEWQAYERDDDACCAGEIGGSGVAWLSIHAIQHRRQWLQKENESKMMNLFGTLDVISSFVYITLGTQCRSDVLAIQHPEEQTR